MTGFLDVNGIVMALRDNTVLSYFVLSIGISLVICHSDQIGSNWRLQSPDRRPDQRRKEQKGAEEGGKISKSTTDWTSTGRPGRRQL
jgi:hypothetical protein